jgi:energy-converting hydrogenase Eha subunit G
VYYVANFLVAAVIFGHAVLRLFEGHLEILGIVIGVGWGFTMTIDHALVRLTWNEWLEGRSSIPVKRWEWWLLGFYCVYSIYVWWLR